MSTSDDDTPFARGADIIREAAARMPPSPGVYRMLDASGNALYVGKARVLPKRVVSYTRRDGLSYRIAHMVSLTARMEYTVTESEAAALLLEANLIKQLKPRYNILLRDDKTFPELCLTADHPFPRIMKHRGGRRKDRRYFGPFASVGALNTALALLQKAFLLRPCADSVFSHRTRPCLQYQIKRCSAPCVGYIREAEYAALVRQAVDFLEGRHQGLQEELAAQMEDASSRLDFERAAVFRDRIAALTTVQNQQRLSIPDIGDADAFALWRDGDACCVEAGFFRGGQHFGHHAYFPRIAKDSTDADILTAFIGQFYQRRTPPPLILSGLPLPDAGILEAALGDIAECRVRLAAPQRGPRRAMLEGLAHYAREALERRRHETAGHTAMLTALAERLGIEEAIERIEVYDNSHTQGNQSVGAMIVAGPEGFRKSAYRTFTVRDAPPDDDYAMLREVLTRRFCRLQHEDAERTRGNWPDLVLIDGGRGHLGVTREIFAELGINNLAYACIAKGPERNAGRETFFLPDREPFQLPPGDALLHYLQQLRDEAHRFAIGTHRKKRAKTVKTSLLDAIPGVGPARKKALLRHFGSALAVRDATLEDLRQTSGINDALAESIHRYFQE